jgi:hypothetical protein
MATGSDASQASVVEAAAAAWHRLQQQGLDDHTRPVPPPARRCSADPACFDDATETVVLATARRARVDEKMTAVAADSEFIRVTGGSRACSASPR